MPKLNPVQKKRCVILQEMADLYWKKHPHMTREEAYDTFAAELNNDPSTLRVINALAASTAYEEAL
ncbi:MAG: hypothetical protein D4S01_03005 [Dehalococcoidia bacterium]|nr:MAG: hypothetical protein D4S01_03005 [Dehalococcoidia bacterium]